MFLLFWLGHWPDCEQECLFRSNLLTVCSSEKTAAGELFIWTFSILWDPQMKHHSSLYWCINLSSRCLKTCPNQTKTGCMAKYWWENKFSCWYSLVKLTFLFFVKTQSSAKDRIVWMIQCDRFPCLCLYFSLTTRESNSVIGVRHQTSGLLFKRYLQSNLVTGGRQRRQITTTN